MAAKAMTAEWLLGMPCLWQLPSRAHVAAGRGCLSTLLMPVHRAAHRVGKSGQFCCTHACDGRAQASRVCSSTDNQQGSLRRSRQWTAHLMSAAGPGRQTPCAAPCKHSGIQT